MSPMGKSKTRRKRDRRGQPHGRKRGGLMLGMRSGFKDMAGAVSGEPTSAKQRWLGRIITVLLLAAAIGLLAQNL